MVLLFSSFRFLPMSQVVSLNFSAPLFTLVFAVAFFGERGLRRTMATMVGFAGMLVIVQPWNDPVCLGYDAATRRCHADGHRAPYSAADGQQ